MVLKLFPKTQIIIIYRTQPFPFLGDGKDNSGWVSVYYPWPCWTKKKKKRKEKEKPYFRNVLVKHGNRLYDQTLSYGNT